MRGTPLLELALEDRAGSVQRELLGRCGGGGAFEKVAFVGEDEEGGGGLRRRERGDNIEHVVEVSR